MRWFWIDRFLEFESRRRAVSVKAISLGEEPLDAQIPGYPVLPASLIVEGIAQTGGLLVSESSGFLNRVVLAKIGKAVFHELAVPGETLTYTAEVEDLRPDGSIVRGTSRVGEKLQAEVEVVFANLDDRFQGVELFAPQDLMRMLRVLGLYEVGRQADGSPLTIPRHLLAAEQAGSAPGSQESGK